MAGNCQIYSVAATTLDKGVLNLQLFLSVFAERLYVFQWPFFQCTSILKFRFIEKLKLVDFKNLLQKPSQCYMRKKSYQNLAFLPSKEANQLHKLLYVRVQNLLYRQLPYCSIPFSTRSHKDCSSGKGIHYSSWHVLTQQDLLWSELL